jgi:hypothetical protein
VLLLAVARGKGVGHRVFGGKPLPLQQRSVADRADGTSRQACPPVHTAILGSELGCADGRPDPSPAGSTSARCRGTLRQGDRGKAHLVVFVVAICLSPVKPAASDKAYLSYLETANLYLANGQTGVYDWHLQSPGDPLCTPTDCDFQRNPVTFSIEMSPGDPNTLPPTPIISSENAPVIWVTATDPHSGVGRKAMLP